MIRWVLRQALLLALVAVKTYCQSFLIWPFCKSLLRKATWQVLQVYGCVAELSCAGGPARPPLMVAILKLVEVGLCEYVCVYAWPWMAGLYATDVDECILKAAGTQIQKAEVETAAKFYLCCGLDARNTENKKSLNPLGTEESKAVSD